MKKFKLQLEILLDVIEKNYWDEDKKEFVTNIEEIDSNEEIEKLNQKIVDLYTSFYNLGGEYVGCELDYDFAKDHIQELENLIELLKTKILEVMSNEVIIEDNTQETIQEIKDLMK